jgi:peptidyl-prolyl cis-trans isomerase D
MMEALRNGAKSWIAKILLGIVMMVFALLGVSSMDTSATIQGLFKQDLASVDGNPISSELFRQDLNRTIKQFGDQTGRNITLEEAKTLGIDRQVLDRMIAQASLDAKASRLGLAVGETAVVQVVQSDKLFQDSTGKFDVTRYRSLLQQNGLTETIYFTQQKQELTRKALTGVAGDNLTLPRTMLDALTRYREESRDARYVVVTVSEADVPQPTEDELNKQYAATPAAYTAPEYRSIAVLKVEPADMASKIQVSDQDIANAYDTFKQEYFQPETRDVLQVSFPDVAAAEKAKARVDAGEDLIKIASELGQKEKDITFAAKRKTDFLDEKISAAAFSLAEGSVSAPVVGSLNTAILKVTKVVAANQPTLSELKTKLQERLQLERAREEIQSVYEAVEDARAQQTKFEDIAAKAGLPLIVVPAINQNGSDKLGQPVSLPAQTELLKAVFASDVGLDTDALSLDEGYVWFDVREVIPSAVRPLAEVKEQVKSDWVAGKRRTLASDKAKAIVEKAGDTTKLETIATEVAGTIKTAAGIKRNAVSEEFDGVATIALFSVPEKALTWALEGDGKTARIIEVSKVTIPSSGASLVSKEVADLARNGLSGDMLDYYLKAARKGTDVTMNEELWRQISGTTSAQ